MKLKSGFTENSEPIIIRRVSNACGISTGLRIMNVNSSPFEKRLGEAYLLLLESAGPVAHGRRRNTTKMGHDSMER